MNSRSGCLLLASCNLDCLCSCYIDILEKENGVNIQARATYYDLNFHSKMSLTDFFHLFKFHLPVVN